MARHSTYLVLLLLAVLLAVPFPAAAQSGVCPDYTNELSPVPTGTYPYSMKMCAAKNSPSDFTVSYSSEHPCGAALKVHPTLETTLVNGEYEPFVVVPPNNMGFGSGLAKLRFQFSARYFTGGNYVDTIVKIESYSYDGGLIGRKLVTVTNYPQVVSQYGDVWFHPDITLPMSHNGYFVLQITEPKSRVQLPDAYFAGFQVSDTSGFPMACTVPGATWPTATPTNSPLPTATNTPQNTPTGTWQPTVTNTPQNTPQPGSTATAWPTSAGGTFTPRATATSYTPKEIDAEPTGTPLPVPELPDISFPSVGLPGGVSYGNASMPSDISFPGAAFGEVNYPIADMPVVPVFSTATSGVGLTPNATTAAEIAQVEGWIADTGDTVDRWSGATTAGLGWLNPDISSTTGISTPIEIAEEITAPVTQPISYIRGLAVYVPHIWPYIFLIFLMLLWIFFNLMAKFGAAIVSEVVDVIRRVIELIPGF